MIPITTEFALAATGRIASVGVIVKSVEMLFYSSKWFSSGLLGPANTLLSSKQAFQLVALARLIAAVAVFALAGSGGPIPPLTVLAATLFSYLRNRHASSAAEDMNVLTFGGLAAGWMTADPRVQQASLWFIALQVSLSYFANGWHKLRTAGWRDGSVLRDVCNTKVYGIEPAGALLTQYPAVAFATSWKVILWECLFPLALLNPAIAVPMAALGALFHAGIAVVMRLNSFFWAFAGCYPAVLWCATYAG